MSKLTVDYPVALHTVDIAILRKDGLKTQVLLGQKVKATEAEKNLWRFPGGFVEPKHHSAEQAAVQEVDEETKTTIVPKLEYIGSTKIDDPRFRNSPHKVITSFFIARWKAGEAGEGPFDDMARTKWFDLDELSSQNMDPIHAPLFAMLFRANNMEIKANEIFKDLEETFDKFSANVNKTFDEVGKGFSKAFHKVGDFFDGDKNENNK